MKKKLQKISLLNSTINLLCGVVVLLLILLGFQVLPSKFSKNKGSLKADSQEQVKVIPTKTRLRLL
ncbi:MAG: hypothetical protein EOP53_12690 [Sphingobacteriales bacterium]|nr:MAG: hypothetical protein EOP53_12690 [Sphingobacteriales bacterium]